eukprot:TRINITY_DN9707_c0_g1_i2.p1 TRINITY_DN9707_c0_g1~~TRINITY_DN9707_c0_g1_i2.p1  ORF type:complete len:211 (+),score=54.83 TRINITY_DN9707_c0_g1_i2:66-635(+)
MSQENSAFETILRLFETHGSSDYIGEAITQSEHALQCAKLASDAGSSEPVILAAMLHDVGHIIGVVRGLPEMGDVGIMAHEIIGGDYLRELGFPDIVVELVKRHVDAKRYYTCRSEGYYNKLSEASKKTLMYQGGPMTPEEADAFDNDPLKQPILLLRTWDDKAKRVGWEVPPFEYYRDMFQRVTQPQA